MDESREVAAEGGLFFEFKYSLAGGKTTLQIADKNAKVYKKNIGEFPLIFVLCFIDAKENC